MSSLAANPIASPATLPLGCHFGRQIKHSQYAPLASSLFHTSHPFDTRRTISLSSKKKSVSVICAAALSARCAAEQTQTVIRESSTITVAPTQGKEKSTDLDDGGAGFPPRDDGDGGGGGGGGGGWSGGFFFFGFLAFLGFLKDKESENSYGDD